jgi:hypothetical protein
MVAAPLDPTINSALEGSYLFGNAQKPSQAMWGSFDRVPPLNVEIGGGMATQYCHRPHMIPEDMPSLVSPSTCLPFVPLPLSLPLRLLVSVSASAWLCACCALLWSFLRG